MRRSIYLIVVVLLSVAVLSGLPSGTQAIDIGEGIQISAADSPNGGYVEDLGEDGGVRVELDGDADDVPGEGVNQDAITRIDRVLRITNTNDNETRGKAFVFIADSNENIVDFYRGSNVDDSIEGSDNQVGLGVGENILVGIEIDTLGEDTGDGSISISEFTVEADISEVANAILEVITGTPTTAGDVRFSANQSDGDELRFEYILETGESEDEQNFINEGPEFNRSYDVLGTYNATVSIDETAPRAPNESDTDTTQFVVRSPPEAGILGVDNSVEVEIPDDLETDDDSETVRRVAVSTTSDSTGNIEATAVAVESLDDLAGNPNLNGDPVAGINVTVPASAAGTTGLVTATIPETAVPTDSSPRNLTVERYDPDADEWMTLPTTLVDQTGGTVTLEAETSDFLLFAITDQPSAQVGPGPAPKFELESLTRVNQGDLVVGEAIVLEATVRNDGGAAVRDVVLSVERQVDGEFEPIPVARQEVQLTQEQSQTVQISHRPSESALANIDDGTGTGTVTFDAEVGQAQDSIDIPVEETLTASVEPGSVTDISDATPGRVIEFEPTITNEEDVAIDTQPVFLQLDGETVDNDTVNLGADQSTTVALSFLPSAQDVGSLNFTVRAPPGSTPVNATVLEPASYQIRDADLPDDAPVAGSEITATAIVNNTGDQNGSRPIKLTLGGSTVNNTILELNPDESTNVTLTFETSINTLAAGGQSTTLQTYSDTEQKSIDLREPATFSIDSVTPSPSNPGPIAGNDLSVDITITNTGGVDSNARYCTLC
ncbi:COG1361 family protein [Haloquadratum walsbyi]|uniref:Probable secreted glycoprotein n=1 Tax=Haloquadratum walsbyi (strain DSM 16854 / JCM 12705 / C23) TaxID=768065 RepID=G0LGT8_HALWC|nr:cell surface glycoprotein [Haloquadratum walsbyi]CCC39640.1 probable secreted glycoprotein [Haloquadratum walsbyi C23]